MNEAQVQEKNAVIESAEICIERGGILGAWLYLDYGGSGQGFGGYALYLDKSFDHHSLKSVAGHFIHRVLQIAGAEKWSKLPGKTIRVKCDWSKVHAIGHIVNDDWFDPEKDFEPIHKERLA